jgi:hypothetical protein
MRWTRPDLRETATISYFACLRADLEWKLCAEVVALAMMPAMVRVHERRESL